MPYREASDREVAFFQEHGWIVVEDAVDPAELAEVGVRCEVILEKKHKLAFDWAWEKGKDRSQREFKIVQSSASMVWPEIAHTRFRPWMITFASALMQDDGEQYLDNDVVAPRTCIEPRENPADFGARQKLPALAHVM